VWIDNYSKSAGLTFIKRFAPKFFVLVGSYEYNTTTNTVTEGTAEGGRKVVLYNINNFRMKGMPGYTPATDSGIVKRMFHVINHEFGHILNQNEIYSEEFKRVTAGNYIATWYNVSMANARREGFITNYAMGSTDEDFVEMVATMLVEGKPGFDRIVNNITGNSPNGTTPAVARARLQAKEAFVVAYFKDVWNVDFYKLAANSRAAIESIIK
jgi:substrate import-associated zinc metallohydrolase lipoprotein